MGTDKLKHIIEALIFASETPLSLNSLFEILSMDEAFSQSDIIAALNQLKSAPSGPLTLQEVSSGYRFQVASEYAPWVSRLFEEKPQRYSRALLETLAIIAYRQPVTRGEIESIRGVAVSTPLIRTLLEREWIIAVGHKELPGRPVLYATTPAFLDYFNLKSLDELPDLGNLPNIMEPIHGTAAD